MGMLKDLLTPAVIRCHVHATDWRDAVTQAGALLEAAGKCDHSYTESMIASIDSVSGRLSTASGQYPTPDELFVFLSLSEL